jgi:predicted nicotinamide N-methyase
VGKKDPVALSHHPLLGLDFIELGAGAGLPSWTAMKCGAKVTCTDQDIPNRIRCMAESAERNLRDMRVLFGNDQEDNDMKYQYAIQAQVCPYAWGEPVSELLGLSSDDGNQNRTATKLFDVVVAADCIYMPQNHSSLLDSIGMLMSDSGLALLSFALHGNVNDEQVWNIVNVAILKGFQVETLDSKQLSPQAINMDSKRGLIHVLRLTRDEKKL